jgi:hypothetical protein
VRVTEALLLQDGDRSRKAGWNPVPVPVPVPVPG